MFIAFKAKILEEIVSAGINCGNPISLYIYDGLPICGMIIKDHNFTDEIMRVSLYTEIYPNRRHPIIEVSPSQAHGRLVRDIFYRYYEEIKDASKKQ